MPTSPCRCSVVVNRNAPPRPCNKQCRYDGIGEIAMRSTNVEVGALPGNRVVVYTPIDDASQACLTALRARADACAESAGSAGGGAESAADGTATAA